MKAYLLDRFGKGQTLRLADVADPVTAPDEVLVEIHAAALNPLDCKIHDGAFKPLLPYKPPFILSHDLAGIVVAVGGCGPPPQARGRSLWTAARWAHWHLH
ncbi:alcohol dehydrogenase catalytic domain-containing protein [Rhizorhabdus dicambivorans]|uniref:alcohol dehydrogenase catalytic domain-containing protein n=1 Tax=Rhizorhabdus dicambivorans TaxID=1850238 RepID=UPI00192CF5D4|nr:alcohol dehydrogenase catalytic domain-containing protein [Rhizorhabdus dicambivorans]